MSYTLNPPSLERQGGWVGNSIKSQVMLLSYDVRLLLPMLLPELAHSTRFIDRFLGRPDQRLTLRAP